MKKQVILSITLLMSLAGCKDDKKKPKLVTQKADVYASVDIPLTDDLQAEFFEEDEQVLSFFDEDLEDVAFADEQAERMQTAAKEVAYDDSRVLSWIESINDENDLKAIHFGFNKLGITSEEKEVANTDIAMVKDLLDVIDEDAIIMIEGHACHSAGNKAYNMSLSEKRAKYVRDLFVAAGIDADRIRIVGRGQEMPVLVDGKPVTGDRDAQWLNRRVEIRIVENA